MCLGTPPARLAPTRSPALRTDRPTASRRRSWAIRVAYTVSKEHPTRVQESRYCCVHRHSHCRPILVDVVACEAAQLVAHSPLRTLTQRRILLHDRGFELRPKHSADFRVVCYSATPFDEQQLSSQLQCGWTSVQHSHKTPRKSACGCSLARFSTTAPAFSKKS